MDSMNFEVTLGVVSYNSLKKVRKLIESLNIYEDENSLIIHLFLLENGNDPENSIEKIRVQSSKKIIVTIVPNHENYGFGGGHNRILQEVKTRSYYVVNPDIEFIDRNFFKICETEFNKDNRIKLISPGIESTFGDLQLYNKFDPTVLDMAIRFTPDSWFKKRKQTYVKAITGYKEKQEIEFASGALMVLRTESFKSVGGFDERYFLYFEDADLSRKIRQNGIAIYNPYLRVRHAWERASRKKIKYFIILLFSMIKYFNKWGWKWI